MIKRKIIDYISNQEIKGTPEEVEAVQPFSEQLVKTYRYPKEHIKTRPQFRVKSRPSDSGKSYPIDITVFKGESHNDEDVYMIIECKKKDRKDGEEQLRIYLDMSNAEFGVWYNGSDKICLHKTQKEGRNTYREIPNIPLYGKNIDNIGRTYREDLTPP